MFGFSVAPATPTRRHSAGKTSSTATIAMTRRIMTEPPSPPDFPALPDDRQTSSLTFRVFALSRSAIRLVSMPSSSLMPTTALTTLDVAIVPCPLSQQLPCSCSPCFRPESHSAVRRGFPTHFIPPHLRHYAARRAHRHRPRRRSHPPPALRPVSHGR